MENKNSLEFSSQGFLYNPETKSVLLQLRDGNAERNPNKWSLFGGLGEDGESPEECFRREMNEELGITLTPLVIKPLCDYLNVNRGTWHYVFYVESALKKSDMKLNEGADFDWVPLEKVFELDLAEKARADLETFIRKELEKN